MRMRYCGYAMMMMIMIIYHFFFFFICRWHCHHIALK